MLVINSKVDVALVADKLNGSSGEQDIPYGRKFWREDILADC